MEGESYLPPLSALVMMQVESGDDMRLCSIEGCGKSHKGHGYCIAHLRRYHLYGDPTKGYYVKDGKQANFAPEYNSWKSMKARCLSPTATEYHNYGGRGIQICERWLGIDGFKNFLEDMGRRPQGYTLDRIDSSKDYCPENCRWADWRTQGSNRRGLAMITYREKTQSLKDWSRELQLPYKLLVQRRCYGWSAERMFEQPIRKREKKRK